jgi:hypothetical protein
VLLTPDGNELPEFGKSVLEAPKFGKSDLADTILAPKFVSFWGIRRMSVCNDLIATRTSQE